LIEGKIEVLHKNIFLLLGRRGFLNGTIAGRSYMKKEKKRWKRRPKK